MTADEFFWRHAVVAGSAFVYWIGVSIQARRIRKKIGHSPNLRPRTSKEELLWVAWTFVIVIWFSQPRWVDSHDLWRAGFGLAGLISGLTLVVAGYAGTLWCYVAMGAAWRIGVDRAEKNQLVTRGPYRTVRHPIYSFQTVMLAGALLLLPTLLSLVTLAVQLLCAYIKASDEESYLQSVHGDEYRGYCARTGKLFPKFFGRTNP